MKFVFRQGLLEAITGDIADDMVNTIDNDNKTIDVKTTVSSINSLPNVVYHGTNTAHISLKWLDLFNANKLHMAILLIN